HLYRRLRPDIIHHVSLKPIVLGTAAARFAPGSVVVNALTGRGYIFAARAVRARMLAPLVSLLLRWLLRRPDTVVLLENEDDRRFVIDTIGVASERTAVNRGSGIDMNHFAVLPMPQARPGTIRCGGRLPGLQGIGGPVVGDP